MASTHHLFFSEDVDRQTLHRRIVPSARQRARQQEQWNDLRDYLVDVLSEQTGYQISTWLQGSYKYGTQIRPPKKGGDFDIDLGLYFEWQGDSDSGAYGPRELKDLVQAALVSYMRDAGDDVKEALSPPKERCARIQFSNGFHIDIPVYHFDEASDVLELATESDNWEQSDPKAFYEWFLGQFSDDDNAAVRRLIRYLKMWAALHNTPLSSIATTVLVADAYSELSEAELDGDDAALAYVVASIVTRLNASSNIPNPVDPDENLNRMNEYEYMDLMTKLDSLANVASRAVDAGTVFESAHIWQEAFHHFFPPAVSDTVENHNRALVPVQFEPDVRVTATAKNNSHIVITGRNEVGPIPRNCKIEFVMLNGADLPSASSVSWVVRNEQEEAEYINDLGHLAGMARNAEETSAYKGTHFMDVTVLGLYGVVLGFKRIPVRVHDQDAPMRNPRRPGWTRIQRRRR